MIRDLLAEDAAAVDALLAASFEERGEADLVTALRQADDLALELVAEIEGRVVGHAAFPRLHSEAGLALAALAPLTVDAEHRRQGLGEALTKQGLSTLGERGLHWCLVLGDPAYYGRFGFSAEAASGFATPYDGAHQMAVRLAPNSPPAAGRVVYPAAFGALG